jgi:inosine-uridine nucleoside N-ribohydrolase
MAFVSALLLLGAASNTPVKLIIDTDIGGGGCNDVDDVVAISIANALQDNGEAEILAIVLDTAPIHCAGAISVLNHYYGRDTIPIGAYNVSTPGASLEMQDPLDYVNVLVSTFDSPIKTSSQAEDGVTLYRRVLAAQPDRSVAISSIGIHTNLAALLKSKPDEHSPLDGLALVARKVMVLAVMGGKYPTGGTECNLCGGGSNQHNHLVASAASSYVAANWPSESKLIWSGFEVGIEVQSGGAGFQKCAVATETSPIRAAMISYEHGPDKSRFSWDPLTTLVAVRGAVGGSCSECTNCNGKNVVDPSTGNNKWVLGAKTNQTYLVLHDAKVAGDVLDALLCQGPKAPTPAPPPTPPPPAPGSWTEAKGDNCYGTRDGGKTSHGATDLEKPVSASCGIMTIVQCQEKCEQTKGCTGISVLKAVGDHLYGCYRKADIDLSKCDHGSSFDTWSRVKGV